MHLGCAKRQTLKIVPPIQAGRTNRLLEPLHTVLSTCVITSVGQRRSFFSELPNRREHSAPVLQPTPKRIRILHVLGRKFAFDVP